MKHFGIVCRELYDVGLPAASLGAPEIRQLSKILDETEAIQACVRGFYQGGFGLLVATNKRLLVVNKGPLWLRVDDEPFAMLSGLEHKYGIVLAKVMITTRSRTYDFTLLKHQPLERFVNFLESMMRGEESDAGEAKNDPLSK